LPADRLAVMQRIGKVLQIDKRSSRASYQWVLKIASNGTWAGQDLVLLLEEDYLIPDPPLR